MAGTYLELQVDFPVLAEQRIKLLLKKSKGEATESDLELLESLAESMRQAVPSVTSEKDKKFLEWAEKMITTLENDLIKGTIDVPIDLDFSKSK